jgi:hypothetical protein
MMRIERGACSPDQAEQALAALDGGEGLYFGVDAGIAGLHPLQATLVTRPALRLGVHEDRLEVRALTAFGQAILDSSSLRDWRGSGPVERLRGFLRCFEPSPDILLLGALRFEAHRLAKAEALGSRLRGNDGELGVFYFPERMLRRDPHGQWSWVRFSLPGIEIGTEPLATAASHSPSPIGDDHAPGGYAEMVGRALTVLRDRCRPMSLATVVHAVDRLAGRLRPDRDAWDAIVATAAPVMLTGAPRAEALRAISELEASPRGWYGGMVAQVASNGDALVGTLLRAAAVRGGVAEVRTGGDLLADSSPEREEAESRLKTRSLWRAFGLEAGPSTEGAASRDAAPLRVRLLADDDPFKAALADTLAALDIDRADDAPVCVIAGSVAAPAGLPVVAIGDAAYRLLAKDGDVEPVPAEHGRVLHCTRAGSGDRFTAARYATHRLVRAPADWQVLSSEEHSGDPVALSSAQSVCLLYRPDYLLCDDTARHLLREAEARLSAHSSAPWPARSCRSRSGRTHARAASRKPKTAPGKPS